MARVLAITALLAAAALAAVGCSGGGGDAGAAGQSTLERAREGGVIRVGYANEAPYAYLDTGSGKLTGEAPEIARVVMRELGVPEVEGVLTEFGSLIPGLKAGRFDMIAAGMYITPARCEQIDFSNPTYGIGEAFAVQAGNPLGLQSYDDIKANGEVKLGVVAGAIQRNYARDLGIPDAQVTVFPDAPSALAAVRSGRVDAYAGTALTVQDLLAKEGSGELERAEPFTDPVIDGKTVRGFGAFGFRQGDDELRAAVNEGLAAFVGTEEHAALVAPFGFTELELPGDVTADALCAGEE
jgi:polar amino acid transport system substrate-binding protein